MSMSTLAISCLLTSNLPWFVDLAFQFPMQYCSLQHWTLLPSPVTSTTGCCFCFGSISSFFLELFLISNSILGTYWPVEFIFQWNLSFCLFILFILWCWRRLLRVLWTARRSSQSILKEIGLDCSLEGMMLKLKLQYCGHLLWRADSFEKTLNHARKDWRQEEKGTTEDELVGLYHQLNGYEFE